MTTSRLAKIALITTCVALGGASGANAATGLTTTGGAAPPLKAPHHAGKPSRIATKSASRGPSHRSRSARRALRRHHRRGLAHTSSTWPNGWGAEVNGLYSDCNHTVTTEVREEPDYGYGVGGQNLWVKPWVYTGSGWSTAGWSYLPAGGSQSWSTDGVYADYTYVKSGVGFARYVNGSWQYAFEYEMHYYACNGYDPGTAAIWALPDNQS
jgi:hypothetical protein